MKHAQVMLPLCHYCSVGANRSKAKNAQEAHEAIRPTKAYLHPQRSGLAPSSQLSKLYGLVWARAIASQMAPAKLLQVLLSTDAYLMAPYTLHLNVPLLQCNVYPASLVPKSCYSQLL